MSFGRDVSVVLRVVYEPDQGEDDEEDRTAPFAMIETRLSRKEARLLLNRFDRKRWIPNTCRSDGRLLFDVR